MQDIDFGKIYSNHLDMHKSIPPQRKMVKEENINRKISTVLILNLVFLLVGISIGFIWGVKNKEDIKVSSQPKDALKLKKQEQNIFSGNLLKSNNVSNVTSTNIDTESKNINNDELDNYIIWAKTFKDHDDAVQYGMALKEKGFPIFITNSPKGKKLYIGPITGNKKASSVFRKIKEIPIFNGAILHKKN